MHVHGSHMDPNALNLYSAVADEKAAAAKRAAEVRKKLMSSTGEVEDELDTASVTQVEKEAEPESEKEAEPDCQRDSERKRPRAEAKQDAAEQEPFDDPMSLWG